MGNARLRAEGIVNAAIAVSQHSFPPMSFEDLLSNPPAVRVRLQAACGLPTHVLTRALATATDRTNKSPTARQGDFFGVAAHRRWVSNPLKSEACVALAFAQRHLPLLEMTYAINPQAIARLRQQKPPLSEALLNQLSEVFQDRPPQLTRDHWHAGSYPGRSPDEQAPTRRLAIMQQMRPAPAPSSSDRPPATKRRYANFSIGVNPAFQARMMRRQRDEHPDETPLEPGKRTSTINCSFMHSNPDWPASDGPTELPATRQLCPTADETKNQTRHRAEQIPTTDQIASKTTQPFTSGLPSHDATGQSGPEMFGSATPGVRNMYAADNGAPCQYDAQLVQPSSTDPYPMERPVSNSDSSLAHAGSSIRLLSDGRATCSACKKIVKRISLLQHTKHGQGCRGVPLTPEEFEIIKRVTGTARAAYMRKYREPKTQNLHLNPGLNTGQTDSSYGDYNWENSSGQYGTSAFIAPNLEPRSDFPSSQQLANTSTHRRQRLPTAGVKVQDCPDGLHLPLLREPNEQQAPDEPVQLISELRQVPGIGGPEENTLDHRGLGQSAPDGSTPLPRTNAPDSGRPTRRMYGVVGTGLMRVGDEESSLEPELPRLSRAPRISRASDDWPDSQQWLEMPIEEVASAVRSHAEQARKIGMPIEVRMPKELASLRCL